MLTVLTTKRKMRRFAVYDFEWVPGTMRLRLCGLYDGERYRAFSSIERWLREVLSSKYRGYWFFAHAGGLADVQFVLENLVARPDYSVRGSFSGSSCIILHVTRGKNAWHFIDSYWLLRDSLANIGKWIGLEKGAEEERQSEEGARRFYAEAPLRELVPYNERDCVILYRAINELENALFDLGGQLQMTLAGSAMALFRRKYLTRDIPTTGAVNHYAKLAYVASRVEVFENQARTEMTNYYDINSSFPAAMMSACPGELLGGSRTLPDREEALYLADVEVSIPDMHMPPIPVRMEGGRIFFPTGRWRSWLSDVDVRLVQREGGRIEKVHEVLSFEPFYDLAAYASDLYERRKRSDGFEKIALKLLLNSLYGKFAESPNKQGLVLHPQEITRQMEMLFPGAFLSETWVPIPHSHVPISVHITALARRRLLDFMLLSSGPVHYCDTDGFSTVDEYGDLSADLGALKLEKRVPGSLFVAPKLYQMDLIKPSPYARMSYIRAKGFSRMTMDKWQTLLAGEEVATTRMGRIRELWRRGLTKPSETTIGKRLQRRVLQKRCHYPDGTSRPWTMAELQEKLGQGKLA